MAIKCCLSRRVVFGDRFNWIEDVYFQIFCQKNLVFQDWWSLMAVVSQSSFHCVLRVVFGPRAQRWWDIYIRTLDIFAADRSTPQRPVSQYQSGSIAVTPPCQPCLITLANRPWQPHGHKSVSYQNIGMGGGGGGCTQGGGSLVTGRVKMLVLENGRLWGR